MLGKSCRTIGGNSIYCQNNCRGDISSGSCWNRCMVNIIRRIVRDTSGMIGRKYNIFFSVNRGAVAMRLTGTGTVTGPTTTYLSWGFYYVSTRPVDAYAPPINFPLLS